MGWEGILGIVLGALASLASGWLLWQAKRKQDNNDDLNERMNKMEAECRMCKASLLTEDKLRKILQEFFDQFELRLINEGRLRPKHQKREET